MTRLFQQAIAKVLTLPDEEQDALALQLMAMLDAESGSIELDDATRAAIREGLEQAKRGEFASEEESAALWKHHGL